MNTKKTYNQDISNINSNNTNILDNTSLESIDAIILCGGLGKRLRPIIYDRPKVLAKIGDTTFLDILINNVSSHRLKNMILCIGHLKDHIKRHFGYYCNNCHNDYNIVFSEEEKPLGTGGAIKNAESLIKSDHFIVMNGDSICNTDFREFLNFHIHKNALLSMVLTRSNIYQDFGNIILDDSQMIVNYQEKMIDKNKEADKYGHLINAGIYIMQKDIFSYMPNIDQFSLEYDFFPKLIGNTKDKCFGFITESELIDIGTPERYKESLKKFS